MRLWHALGLVGTVFALWAIDVHFLGWGVASTLGKQLFRVTEWMAVWR
ncbi:MAG: hypothetical protein AAGI50_09315 [Pseudomonadota bacterium]